MEALSLDEILAQKKAGIESLKSRRLKHAENMVRWVEETPDAIALARGVVNRRLARQYCHGRELLLEWRAILDSQTKEKIVAILRDESDQTEQLRSSSPFLLIKN